MAKLKIDKGTAEKLLQTKEIREEWSKNLSGKELTLEIDDNDIFMDLQNDGGEKWLELSDSNGSFGIWIKFTPRIKDTLKRIMGP